jgi:hypothetical protein
MVARDRPGAVLGLEAVVADGKQMNLTATKPPADSHHVSRQVLCRSTSMSAPYGRAPWPATRREQWRQTVVAPAASRYTRPGDARGLCAVRIATTKPRRGKFTPHQPMRESTMNTKFRRWAVRIVGTVALPAALAVGVGAASASAQPTVAAHVTSSTQQARPDYWHPAGFYYNYYQCV